jgi:hypothetical protein
VGLVKAGAVIVLFDNISLPSRVANVLVPVGKVMVPELEILEITGVVNVLLVNVSLPARVANVCVPVGKVIVPELEMLEITGAVNVLLVNVSLPVRVANVPVVGRMTEVVAVEVNVVENAPAVVRVLPGATVTVEALAGVVKVILFIDLATCKLPFNEVSAFTYKR